MKYLKIILIPVAVSVIIVFALNGILLLVDTEQYTLDDSARKNADGSYIQLTDGITHYELDGPDSGKVVVLVHGFSVPYYIWDSTYVKLVHEGYRVLRYDEYGRGYSDRPDKVYKASLLRRQLEELLAALKIQSVHAIAGLSFGGPVVTDFVIHHPSQVDKIILVDPFFPLESEKPTKSFYPESLMEVKMALSPEDMVNGQLSDLKYPERFPQWTEQYKAQMQYKGFRHALISTRLHYASPETMRANYKELSELHKPILLVWGKEDNTTPFSSSDELRKIITTEFMAVDAAAHLPHMEKASVVNERIYEFLKTDK